MENRIKIALIGAGGMSFGPVMTSDVLHTPSLRGCVLALMDIDERRLETARRVAERLNHGIGNPCVVEASTSLDDSVKDAQFALISVEKRRFQCWDQDFDIPRKYGSNQILGENGGPGSVFHALRTVPLVVGICRRIEKVNPNVLVINLTNPMSPVTLGINKGTKLRNIGLCHEFLGGVLALSLTLRLKKSRILAKAHGTNHFSWFYEIKDARTGEDLYPKVRRHFQRYPFLHMPLVRHCLNKYALLCITTDDHMGEYLTYATDIAKPAERARRFYKKDFTTREWLCARYAAGRLPIPAKIIPLSYEEAIPLIEALATGKIRQFNAGNFPNKGYIPNLPDGIIVEVSYRAENGELKPDNTPPMQADLAEIMKLRGELQNMIVDAALGGDADLAFQALCAEPISPKDPLACRLLFDELYELQKDLLPF